MENPSDVVTFWGRRFLSPWSVRFVVSLKLTCSTHILLQLNNYGRTLKGNRISFLWRGVISHINRRNLFAVMT